MGDQLPEFLPFGILSIVVLGALLLVPVLRGHRGLLTARSFVLLSGIIYVGVGSIDAYLHRLPYRQLEWFTPTKEEMYRFFGLSVLFYSAFLLFFWLIPSPKRFTLFLLGKAPRISFPVLVVVLSICIVTVFIGPLLRPVPFLGEVMLNFAQVGVSVGAAFATAYWVKSRMSVAGLCLLLAVLAVLSIEAMLIFHGRRILLSVFVGPVIVLYWMRWRHWRPSRVLLLSGGSAAALMLVVVTYSTFRHYDSRSGEQRSRSGIVARLSAINVASIRAQLVDIPHYLAQSDVHFAILVMRMVDTGQLDTKPLESALHVATYPVPRRFWPDKPIGLGKYFIHGVLHLPNKNTVGLNVVGHAAAEGGAIAIVVYALMLAVLVRLYDDALYEDPENPFLLASLAAAAPHLVCWVRGGVSTMTINCLEPLVMIILLGVIARVIVGSASPAMGIPTGMVRKQVGPS